jgi:hypothetical protein
MLVVDRATGSTGVILPPPPLSPQGKNSHRIMAQFLPGNLSYMGMLVQEGTKPMDQLPFCLFGNEDTEILSTL